MKGTPAKSAVPSITLHASISYQLPLQVAQKNVEAGGRLPREEYSPENVLIEHF
jgi:hypothetical protein